MPFDPNKHLMKLKGKDYLPVASRLQWFRDEWPCGVIETEAVVLTDDKAVFVATVRKVDADGVVKGSATGTKSETPKGFADYIEKSETGSIGRALAALGFGTQFAPEFDEGERIVDSPQQSRRGAQNAAQPDATPTPHAPTQARRAPQGAPEPPIDREKIIHRLHSYVPHDALHNWAVSDGLASLADVSTDDLIALGKSFKTGGATPFMAQHAPPAGQSSIDGLDDLHAQLDRQQAAERARQ